jgi:acetylornithine deacetylase
MDGARRRVLAEVDRRAEETVAFLQSLIRRPSLPGGEADAQALMAEKLAGMGLRVDVWDHTADVADHPAAADLPSIGHLTDRANLVGLLPGAEGGRSLLLNGHMDVVPVEPLDAWSTDPWGGEVRDGRVFGRGACDMKGGVAAMTMALDCVLSAGFRPRGDVLIASMIDEEIGGHGTLASLLRGYRADAAVVTEPTELEIHTAQRGSLLFRIRVAGRAAHAGYKGEGVSAVEKAMDLYQMTMRAQDERRGQVRHPLFTRFADPTSINIGVFRGGAWMATVPDAAELEGVIGILPGEEPAVVRQWFEAYLVAACAMDPWLVEHPPTVEWLRTSAPAQTPTDHPAVAALHGAVRQACGDEPVLSAFPAGCDMRLLTEVGGIPTIIFGPGSLRQAHTHDEFVPVNELVLATRALALLIADWCGLAEGVRG